MNLWRLVANVRGIVTAGAGLSVSKKNGVPWDSDLMTTKNNNRPELIFCDRGRGIKL